MTIDGDDDDCSCLRLVFCNCCELMREYVCGVFRSVGTAGRASNVRSKVNTAREEGVLSSVGRENEKSIDTILYQLSRGHVYISRV